MNASLAELRKRPHTSISSVRTFLTCPRKYNLQYVLRVRPDFLPAALALGGAWHEAIADWLTEKADDEALDERLRQGLRERLHRNDIPILFDDEDETEDDFIAKAVTMFASFRARAPRPERVLASEAAFSTELIHPRTGEFLALPVIGAIDVIVVESHGGPALWELKTGKKKWSEDQAEFDLQTTLYRRAAREMGFADLQLRVLVTTKAKVPDVQTIELHRNDADEAELAEIFFSVHRAIRAGVSHPMRGWQCRSCQYASSCRA